MARKIPTGKWTAMLLCFATVMAAGIYGPIKPYVQAVKSQSESILALTDDRKDDPLMEWIRKEAPSRNEAPVNAVIDRVWKAIPGYDGRVVDIQATYLKAKLIGSSPGRAAEFPWVYKTLKPAVSLQDLPMQPIYRGNSAKPSVGLMINVAWGDEHLPKILAILKEADVKATFFFDGTWLSKNLDTAKQIMAQGHEVSNHAYTHPDMSKLGLERQRQEIGKTESLLKQLGAHNVWFAPPSGYYNEYTVKAASEFGLRTVLWTLDTIDWKLPEPSSVVDKVARKAGPGTLILMHPTPSTAGALRGMIREIKAKGLVPGTVSEALSPERLEDRL